MHRFYDLRFQSVAVKILPGESYVTGNPDEMLVTVLGSCVSACIRDPTVGIGGMNHFMLPTSQDGHWGPVSAAMRYGNFAMERLINDILSRGGRREHLEIKAFGGAAVSGVHPIGEMNATFLEEYLREEGLAIAAQCLRPLHPLRVHYFPATGQAFVLSLPCDAEDTLAEAEAAYRKALSEGPPVGEIELFAARSHEPPHPRSRR